MRAVLAGNYVDFFDWEVADIPGLCSGIASEVVVIPLQLTNGDLSS